MIAGAAAGLALPLPGCVLVASQAAAAPGGPPVGQLAGGLVGLGAGAVFDAAGSWVAAGATWFLRQLVAVVSATTAPPITAAWFAKQVSTMTAVGGVLALPLTLCAAVQAVVRQSPGMVVRVATVNLPVALTLTGMAVTLVHLGLSITDSLSSGILSASGVGPRGGLSPLAGAFGTATASGAPSFALLLGAVVVAVAALGLWIEMAVRSAAVSVAVLFLPLVMAAFVWPAVSHWCRRLADTLVALILSKLVVVGALGLATMALGRGVGGQLDRNGFGALVTGAALLVVASAAPFVLLRLIPAVEAGAVAQLDQARGHVRHAMGAPRRAANLAADLAEARGARAGGDEAPAPIGPVGPAGAGPASPGPPPGGAGPSGAGPSGAGPSSGAAAVWPRPTEVGPPAPGNPAAPGSGTGAPAPAGGGSAGGTSAGAARSGAGAAVAPAQVASPGASAGGTGPGVTPDDGHDALARHFADGLLAGRSVAELHDELGPRGAGGVPTGPGGGPGPSGSAASAEGQGPPAARGREAAGGDRHGLAGDGR